MTENKMAQVAAMFGKKLGEEFRFEFGKNIIKAKFTDKGLMSADFAGKWWPCCYLPALLIGEAVIADE